MPEPFTPAASRELDVQIGKQNVKNPTPKMQIFLFMIYKALLREKYFWKEIFVNAVA